MNRLTGHSDGLWTLPFPFSMGGIQLGGRTTIVGTPQGLILISPGPLEADDLSEIRALGTVVGLIAPNLMHHLFMAAAQEQFPQAQVWLAPGLPQKRPDLKYDHLLGPAAPELWRDVLPQILVPGMPSINETVFFHAPSATLILTDLAFHCRHCSHWPTRAFLKLNGAWQRFGPTRLLRHYFLTDRQAFRSALQRILEWPFERVVVAHGEVLESGGREALRQAYSWSVTP